MKSVSLRWSFNPAAKKNMKRCIKMCNAIVAGSIRNGGYKATVKIKAREFYQGVKHIVVLTLPHVLALSASAMVGAAIDGPDIYMDGWDDHLANSLVMVLKCGAILVPCNPASNGFRLVNGKVEDLPK